MTASDSTKTNDTSLLREWLNVANYYIGGRRNLLILGIVAILAGMALNWNWLVATGLAPILLTALPCAVMCGLGLCAHKLFGNESCSTQSQAKGDAVTRGRDSPMLLDGSATSGETSVCGHEPDKAGEPSDAQKVRSIDERRDPHA